MADACGSDCVLWRSASVRDWGGGMLAPGIVARAVGGRAIAPGRARARAADRAWDMIGSPEQARSTTRGTPRLACTALLASRWVGGVTAPELNRSRDGADGAGLGVNRAGRGSRRRRTDRTRGVRRRGLGGGVSVGVIALVVKP